MLRLPTFTYHEPKTLAQAFKMKAEAGPDGMYVAGGTDLYPNMKRRHQEPTTVISLARIKALHRKPRVHASTRQRVLSPMMTLTDVAANRTLRKQYPAVTTGAELISTPLLRNMGTLGGNLCLDTRCTYLNQSFEWRKAIDFCMKKDGAICWVAPSSPRCWAVQSSDLAPVMAALGAEYLLAGPGGERLVRADEFYRNDGIDFLSKQPDEILAEIRLPALNGWDATYHKLRRRGSFDFPVLGVAVWIKWDGATVAEARIVLGGVASWPQLVPEASAAIVGTSLDDQAVDAAAQAAFKPSKPMDNTDFHLAWRKDMTRVWVRRALVELRTRVAP